MNKDPKKQIPPVLRITIDEKLEDDLIRILVAQLNYGEITFSDDSSYWQEEEEFLVKPSDYQKKMYMTQANAKKWSWDRLHEGQVFLIGRFQSSVNRSGKNIFITDTKKRKFQRIDPLIKDHVKKKYFTALERRISDGKADQTG